MKTIPIATLALVLLATQPAKAQGVFYLSNMRESFGGTLPVGSDSWLAAGFTTGVNAGGYSLDAVQLVMGSATGIPSGFSVSLYTSDGSGGAHPGTLFTSLSGFDPTAAGIHPFSGPDITLSASTSYFIVVTSATPIADGAYPWSLAATASYDSIDGWAVLGGSQQSSDGVNWTSAGSLPFRFSVIATAVPEPTTWALFTTGLIFLLGLRKSRQSKRA